MVALLKELGATETLSTIVEGTSECAVTQWRAPKGKHARHVSGESLLNDGSAVVLFTFVYHAIGYANYEIPPPWMECGGVHF